MRRCPGAPAGTRPSRAASATPPVADFGDRSHDMRAGQAARTLAVLLEEPAPLRAAPSNVSGASPSQAAAGLVLEPRLVARARPGLACLAVLAVLPSRRRARGRARRARPRRPQSRRSTVGRPEYDRGWWCGWWRGRCGGALRRCSLGGRLPALAQPLLHRTRHEPDLAASTDMRELRPFDERVDGSSRDVKSSAAARTSSSG